MLTGIGGRVAEGERLSAGRPGRPEGWPPRVRERLPGTVVSVSTDLDAELVDGARSASGPPTSWT